MSELVSVIVPVYNIEEYLPRCLACLKAQTYTNLEIILVDDGSTDGSGRLCDEFAASDPRARVIHHPENKGLWAARNTGQEAAHGEYLWFPDGDDYFHRDIVKVMMAAINRTDDAGERYDMASVGCKRTARFDEDIVFSIDDVKTRVFSQTELIHDLFVVFFPNGVMWNKLFRSNYIQDIRSHDYARHQDWDFCFRSHLSMKKAIVVDKPLYYYVRRPGSAVMIDDYRYLSAICLIKIYYNNYRNISNVGKNYDYYLLYVLYKNMVLAEEEFFGKKEWHEIVALCKKVLYDTRSAYLKCSKISFSERISRTLMVEFPKAAHFLIIIRKRFPVRRLFFHSGYTIGYELKSGS